MSTAVNNLVSLISFLIFLVSNMSSLSLHESKKLAKIPIKRIIMIVVEKCRISSVGRAAHS